MSIDAGTAQIVHAYMSRGGGGDPVGAAAEGSLEVHLGRAAAAMERQCRNAERQQQIDIQAVSPVDIPPIDFTVTAGVAGFKSVRAAASDASPNEGYYWFVTRWSLSGLNAGDVVSLFRTGAQAGSRAALPAYAEHTFAAPAGVAAGLGVADWEPGLFGFIMRPDDTVWLASAGTLLATEIILKGQAIQVAFTHLPRFLL